MNDPHVESLRYQLITADDISFDAPPIKHKAEAFDVYLDDNQLEVKMKEHFGTADEAREAVQPFLEAWTIDVGLRHQPEEIQFRFEDAEIVDRSPSERDDEAALKTEVLQHVHLLDQTSVHITRGEYPDPPADFEVSPDVRTMWHRYKGYTEGQESLFAMAYFCLTVLKTRGSQREDLGGNAIHRSAEIYNIEISVLDDLGKITSLYGTPKTARKHLEDQRPATNAERNWVEAVVKGLIRQAGKHAAGIEPSELTMSDLPPK
jgi:hypothetical protein